MEILITGGAGYIGSHTVVELLEAKHNIVVVDNLSNSSKEALRRVELITGRSAIFRKVDVCDMSALSAVFNEFHFDAVIHFAGLKSVGESVQQPLGYYSNNINSTLILLEVMKNYSVNKLIFSSSATVYGTPLKLPITETSRVGIGITNPYGQTKYMIEQILRDVAASDPAFACTILRYFNPIGAHYSGQIGEDPNGPPNNLVPYVSQVAVGKRDCVTVYGDSYDTPDGTGVRDYIHVVDLARGHLAALNHTTQGLAVYNLGTGKGTSVLEVIHTFSIACGHNIPYVIGQRRPGDIASCYANVEKAKTKLNWVAKKSIQDACNDAWRWQSNNPNGYSK